jgi:hypothetical protein
MKSSTERCAPSFANDRILIVLLKLTKSSTLIAEPIFAQDLKLQLEPNCE